jgi:hypothetical protein
MAADSMRRRRISIRTGRGYRYTRFTTSQAAVGLVHSTDVASTQQSLREQAALL